jgi:hypothetical protein
LYVREKGTDLKKLRKYTALKHKEVQCKGKRQQITFKIHVQVILLQKAVAGQVLTT